MATHKAKGATLGGYRERILGLPITADFSQAMREGYHLAEGDLAMLVNTKDPRLSWISHWDDDPDHALADMRAQKTGEIWVVLYKNANPKTATVQQWEHVLDFTQGSRQWKIEYHAFPPRGGS